MLIMEQKIGWIGTGSHGKPMCSHLIKAGHEVRIYSRTAEKCNDLVEIGAQACISPEEVANESDIIFTMLGFPQDVHDVYFGSNGLLSGVKKGAILIDMTTSEPLLAKKIYETAKLKGAHVLDAPINGDDLAARNRNLSFMVGGEKDIFEEIEPLFMRMGKSVTFMGPSGSGQSTKITNQILIASTMVGVVESLQYAYKKGLDLMEVIEVIGKGTAASWSINNLGTRIVNGKFDTGFFIKHLVKDMRIALKEASDMNLSLPGLAMVHQFYLVAMNMDLANKGTHALHKVYARMNDNEFSK